MTQPVAFVLFLTAGIAETHRLPFDIPEAESELVAGFHSEYSGMKFGMFFIGEYLGIILISAMVVTIFFGGWLGPVLPPIVWFTLKTFVFIIFFILLRASLPRPRVRSVDGIWLENSSCLLPCSICSITGAFTLLKDEPLTQCVMISLLQIDRPHFPAHVQEARDYSVPEEKIVLHPRWRGRIVLTA